MNFDFSTPYASTRLPVFARNVVSTSHPLAALDRPLRKEDLISQRMVSVADTARRLPPRTVGLLMGQDTLTVQSMIDKLNFQLAGLGAGYLPTAWVRPAIDAGRLVEKAVEETRLPETFCIAWRTGERGASLDWWVERLRDSKLLSPARRAEVEPQVRAWATAVATSSGSAIGERSTNQVPSGKASATSAASNSCFTLRKKISAKPKITGITPSQTVGPFFAYALPYGDGPRLVPEGHPDAIRIHGRVLDGAGDPLAGIGLQPMPMGPEPLRAFMASEVAKWVRLAKDANVQPE